MARKAKTRAAALAATAGFAGAQAAQASDPPQYAPKMTPTWDGIGWNMAYENQRAANDPILTAVHKYAQAFWEQRGVRSSSPTKLYVADDLTDADGVWAEARAGVPSNGYNPAIVMWGYRAGEGLQRLRTGNKKQQRKALKALYSHLAHEEGHVRGLPHTEDGLMSEKTPPSPGDWRLLLQQLRADGLVPQPTATRTATARRQSKRKAK